MNVQQVLLADKASLEKAISLDEMKRIWLQGVVELEMEPSFFARSANQTM